MAWYPASSVTFANATGSPIGPPLPSSSAGGYRDMHAQWQIGTNGRAICINAQASSKWVDGQLLRPDAEATVNCREITRFFDPGTHETTDQNTPQKFIYHWIRNRIAGGQNTGLVAGVSLAGDGVNSQFEAYPVNADALNTTAYSPGGIPSFAATLLDYETVTSGSSVVQNLYDASAGGEYGSGALIATRTLTFSDLTAGVGGIFTSGPSSYQVIGSKTFSNAPPPTIAISPTTATAGVNLDVTIVGTNTNWTSQPSFYVVGIDGCGFVSITTPFDQASQSITIRTNPGTAAGTLTFGEQTDSATATMSVAAPGGGNGGTPTPTSTPTPVTIAADAAGFDYRGRWVVGSGLARTINCGSAVEFGYSGDTCVLRFDLTGITHPVDVVTQVDDGPRVRTTLGGSVNSVTLAPAYTSSTSVKQAAHSARLVAAGIDEF